VQVDGSSAGISDDAPPLAKALMTDEIADVPDEIFTTLVEVRCGTHKHKPTRTEGPPV